LAFWFRRFWGWIGVFDANIFSQKPNIL